MPRTLSLDVEVLNLTYNLRFVRRHVKPFYKGEIECSSLAFPRRLSTGALRPSCTEGGDEAHDHFDRPQEPQVCLRLTLV